MHGMVQKARYVLGDHGMDHPKEQCIPVLSQAKSILCFSGKPTNEANILAEDNTEKPSGNNSASCKGRYSDSNQKHLLNYLET